VKPFFRNRLKKSPKQLRFPLPAEIFLPALEENWSVRYRRTSSAVVQARCNGSGILNVTGYVDNETEVLTGLRRWLVRKARSSLVPWLEELSAAAHLSYGNVAVRGQKTRWASCSSQGNINLNYKLLFLQADVVRYVLHHELCHTVHANHSMDFWSAVASLEPGYRFLNELARKGMVQVPEWAKA
jgi:predicted metal-dependent hydrolase